MCEDDDDQDYAVETAGEDSIGSREGFQGGFVEEGKKWFCAKREDSLKDCQEGKCFADFIRLHELGHVGSAGGGDGVPEHEQDITDVENPHLSEERCSELADDGAEHGDSEDGGVPPLEDAAHEGNNSNLQYITVKRPYSTDIKPIRA